MQIIENTLTRRADELMILSGDPGESQPPALDSGLSDGSDDVEDASKDARDRNTISKAAEVMSAPGIARRRPMGIPSRFGGSEPSASMTGPKLAQAGNVVFMRFDIINFLKMRRMGVRVMPNAK